VKKQIQRWLQNKIGIGENRDQILILEKKIASLSLLQEWSMDKIIPIPTGLLEATKAALPEKYKSVNCNIHCSDPMFRYPLQVHGSQPLKVLKEYFLTGLEAAEFIYNQNPKAQRILDFGGGYGRVSRFLHIFFPNAQIQFQIENFGSTIDDHNPVDIIFAGSVFTHLPKTLFERTLHQLMDAIEKGNTLILTLHQFIEEEFLFYPHTEESAMQELEDSLDESQYGSVYCSKEFFEYCLYSHQNGNSFKYSTDYSARFGGTQQYLIIKRL
jgi:hypothetical protein